MKKHFYSHLLQFDSLYIELDKLELSGEEKEHLLELVYSSTHHAVLDVILSELSEEDKIILLKLVEQDNHDKIWKHLKDKIDDIEKKITKTAEELKNQLHKDIKKLK